MKPKLKVGDKFVYTKEMNDAKMQSSIYHYSDHKFIGKNRTIEKIDKKESVYEVKNSGMLFPFDVIDDYLPKKQTTGTIVLKATSCPGHKPDTKIQEKAISLANSIIDHKGAQNYGKIVEWMYLNDRCFPTAQAWRKAFTIFLKETLC